MKNINYKNRGMFLESVINNSIKLIHYNNEGYFQKQNLNIKFKKINKSGKQIKIKKGYVYNKTNVDYIGIYKGIFIAFEAKSTELDYLLLSNIRKHQHKFLEKINGYKGISFYIVCYKKYNEFYIVTLKDIEKCEKKLKRTYCKKYCTSLSLTYPGTINFVEYIDRLI